MASPLQGRSRANIQSDQVAYVGAEGFEANQFLPRGTTAYTVYGEHELDDDERWLNGPEKVGYALRDVPVGTPASLISQLTADTIAAIIAARKKWGSLRGAAGGTSDLYLYG